MKKLNFYNHITLFFKGFFIGFGWGIFAMALIVTFNLIYIDIFN